jgi:predicted CopG family antitoxin
MYTTIQVKDHTMKMLSNLKRETHAKSYDDVLQALLKSRRKSIDSMYGFLPKGDILTDLRDKHDRF